MRLVSRLVVVAHSRLSLLTDVEGHPGHAFAERAVVDPSGWAEEYPLPSKSAIFEGRQRLGSGPLADIVRTSWEARLVVPETPGGRGEHGRESGVPMAQVPVLCRVWHTHAIFAARIGATVSPKYRWPAIYCPARWKPGKLLAADRGFFSYALWRARAPQPARTCCGASADKAGPKPTHLEEAARWQLAGPPAPDPLGRRLACGADAGAVIDYIRDDGRDPDDGREPVVYRLFTTLLDPDAAPAVELATAYAQRWETENAFDEHKAHHRGPRVALRSKSPCDAGDLGRPVLPHQSDR